ncbi:hypothetical protein SAMN05660841_04357 [Sphingobacterium nematocida]|uniref:Uncharacterized protein n=1 Tax=Sphingobacterium nematocida TaxID=1513896 RepID=A0A1T5GTU7_9SPHI|nr:hypothetical protein SAMN05660841_04357 [Sphingobacterium nematocida]
MIRFFNKGYFLKKPYSAAIFSALPSASRSHFFIVTGDNIPYLIIASSSNSRPSKISRTAPSLIFLLYFDTSIDNLLQYQIHKLRMASP